MEAEEAEYSRGPDVRGRIHPQDESSIVFPLSDTVKKLLSEFSGDEAPLTDASPNFTPSLMRFLWTLDALYEFASRMVLRCDDFFVAKILGGVDTTEYVGGSLRVKSVKLPTTCDCFPPQLDPAGPVSA